MSVTLSFDFKYKIKMIIAFLKFNPKKNKKPQRQETPFCDFGQGMGFLWLPPPQGYW